MNKRRTTLRILSYIFLTVSSFVMAYPILFTLLGAFTTSDRFIEAIILPIPNTLNLGLFLRAFEAVKDAYLFTLIRVVFYVSITLVTGIFGGYVFSKLRFPGRNRLFLLFLIGMVMPSILMMVPMFLQMAWFPLAGGNNILGQGGHGFISEWPVLFLYSWVSPVAIFLLKQSFDMLPFEYQDAAKMDGAGIFTIIFRVYGPLLKPPIVALVVITFLGIWNDYLWPSLTIASNPAYYPISYLIRGFGGGNAGYYPAGMILFIMVTWPPAAIYFLLQRYFIQGMVASGLKG